MGPELFHLRNPKFGDFEFWVTGSGKRQFKNILYFLYAGDKESRTEQFIYIPDNTIRDVIVERISRERDEGTIIRSRPMNIDIYFYVQYTPTQKQKGLFRGQPYYPGDPSFDFYIYDELFLTTFEPYDFMVPGHEEQDIDIITDRF